MHRLVNRGGELVPPDDLETQLEEVESRPSRVHEEPLPLPPRPPSIASERVRWLAPPVLAALITAAATLFGQWFAGFGRVELDPVTKERLNTLPTMARDLSELKADVKGLAGMRELDRDDDQDRRREVDSELARHQQQIEALRDRYR